MSENAKSDDMNKLKEAFIDSYDKGVSPTALPRIFDVVRPLEEYYGKDCCNFTIEEIISAMMAFRSADVGTLRQKASLLRTYTNFCIASGFSIDGINHYVELTSDILMRCIDKKKAAAMILTPDDIEEILSELDNSRDKFLILAPYEGICGKEFCELTELTIDDLLGNNRVRLCDGRIISVSKRLYNIMIEASETDTMTRSNGYVMELVPSKYILRAAKSKRGGEAPTRLTVKSRISKIADITSRPTLGVLMLRNSGFYWKFNQLFELSNRDYNSVFNSTEFAEIIYQYNVTPNENKIRSDHREMLSVLF